MLPSLSSWLFEVFCLCSVLCLVSQILSGCSSIYIKPESCGQVHLHVGVNNGDLGFWRQGNFRSCQIWFLCFWCGRSGLVPHLLLLTDCTHSWAQPFEGFSLLPVVKKVWHVFNSVLRSFTDADLHVQLRRFWQPRCGAQAEEDDCSHGGLLPGERIYVCVCPRRPSSVCLVSTSDESKSVVWIICW